MLVWDPTAPGRGMELGRHDGPVRAVAGLADGRVVSGGDDGRILIWNLSAPNRGLELGRHDGSVRTVAGLADGRVVSGGVDPRVRVWSTHAPATPTWDITCSCQALARTHTSQPGVLHRTVAHDDVGMSGWTLVPVDVRSESTSREPG